MAPRDPIVPSGGSSPSRKPTAARAGWRGKSTLPQRHEPSSASRSWWSARRSEPARNVGFRVKLATSILILAVMIGVYIWLLPKEPKVPLIALGVTYSNHPLLPDRPPNGWTAEDFDRFETLKHTPSDAPWFLRASLGEVDFEKLTDKWGADNNSPEAALQVLEERLRNVAPGGPDENVILIYISAHGVVNRKNEPCLLLEDSNPLKEETWLDVKTLCENICEAQPKGNVKNVKKVLVLDCNRIDFNGSCGVLYNSFADQLKVLVERGLDKEKCRGLVVLNSTSPGQIGWAAPELGGSVFGSYFFQALSGGAEQDSTLSLMELTKFLAEEVDVWVLENRQGHQTPMAIQVGGGTPDDFDVAKCNSDGPTDKQLEDWRKQARKSWDDDAAWSAVGDLWDKHDKLKTNRLYSLDPLRWAQLERGLLRLEQLLLAGTAYKTERTKLIEELTDLVKEKQPPQVPAWACSLELVRQSSTELDTREPSLDLEKADGETQADAAANDSYYRRADTAWSNLLKKSSVSLGDLNKELKRVKQRPSAGSGLVEVHFLRMLERYVDEAPGNVDWTALAIKSRDKAESAAAPGDYRAHYWVTHWVNEADKLRRMAEDLLLVGPSSADEDRTRFEDYENDQWNMAKAGYDKAQSAAQEISKAFELRDRGWAQVPYLAQWIWAERIAERDNEADSKTKTPQLAPDAAEHWAQLREVTRDLRAISSELDDELAKTTDGTFDVNIWKTKTEKLNSNLENLTTAFQAQSRELLGMGEHQAAFASIARHLDLPLVEAQSRRALRQHYLTFLRNYRHDAKRAERRNTETPPADDLGEIANHPFLELLNKPAQDVAAAEQPRPNWDQYRKRLAEQGGEVRDLLKTLDGADGAVQGLLTESDKQLDLLNDEPKSVQTDWDRKSIAKVRRGLSQADRRVRAAAALWDAQGTANPTLRLHEFDLHQCLLWQCNRTLDDFWGPAEPGGKDYFAVAGREFIGAAEKLFPAPAGTVLRAHTSDLLKRREAAAEELLTASSNDDLVFDEAADTNRLPLLSIRQRSADLPPGIAAAFVCYTESETDTPVPLAKDQQKKKSPAPGNESNTAWAGRIGIPIDLQLAPESIGIVEQDAGKEDVNYLFKFKSESKTKPPFQAVVSYRGHRRENKLTIAKRGPTIVYTPTVPPPPSVRVRGDEKVPTSVMFIFDCSRSMLKKDFPRGDGVLVTRLEGARDTLINILKQPSLRQFPRVGLRIYGHRFVQDVKGDTYPSRYAKEQEKAALKEGRLFKKLDPGIDVELVYPIDTFDNVRRDEMIATLQSLEPWGFTPLYLAIKEAVTDTLAKNEVRRIVVITDGFNDQGSATNPTTAARLDEIFNNPRIKLDIIGFGDEFARDLKPQAVQDRKDMKRIANDRGGRFYEPKTAVDLLDSIQKSLNLAKFEVARSGNSSDRHIKELNETWTEDPELRAGAVQRKEFDYKVRVTGIDSDQMPNMNITLSGGEAIELFLERISNRPTLVYQYYDPKTDKPIEASNLSDREVAERLNALGKLVTAPGPAGEKLPKFFVAAGSASRIAQGSAATFSIQIQNLDRNIFSRRPAAAWIEISPLQVSDEPEGTVYRFCDLDFKDGKPVPRLVCTAPSFPYETCKKAQIELWFKMESMGSDGLTSLSVEKLLDRNEPVDGVSIGAEVHRPSPEGDVVVEIRERRPQTAAEKPEPGRVKIEIMEPAKRVMHDYEAGRHQFYFDKSAEVNNFTVRLTSVEKFKNAAIHCPPLTVSVGR
jgi:hypothetical protein